MGDGKVILITGATDGLGEGLADELAGLGHTVLVHGRDPERVASVSARTGGARSYVADLSRLSEVQRLAQEALDAERRLDVLINNAATGSRQRKVSADGYELSFAVNYLSHFLLTHLLLPLLQRSRPARIINVSSAGQVPIAFDDIMLEKRYNPAQAYGQSKLAQIMFTLDLAEHLPAGVTVNAVHPATMMDTKMVREAFGRGWTTVAAGVGPVARMATAPEFDDISGGYYDQTRPKRANEQAYDADARARLWRLSCELTGRPALPASAGSAQAGRR